MRKYALGTIFALVFLCVLYVGKPIIMPFVLAVFIWYMVNILTDFYGKPLPGLKIKLPRPVAFTVALATIISAVYIAMRIILSNISEVSAAIPAYQYNLEQMSRRLLAFIPWDEPLSFSKLMAGVDFGSVARVAATEVTSFLGKGFIILIYLLFLFFEQGSFKNKLASLFPDPHRRSEIDGILKRINDDIRTYIGIKTVVSLVTAILCYFVMASVGLNFASFWAFLVFVLNFIPTVGSIIATIIPTFFALMQFENLGPFLVVLIGVGVLEGGIGSVIEPRFQGDRLNLSPLVILFSLALWNMVWGVPGMFLCVPLTSIAMIILSHFEQTKPIAIALSRMGKLKQEKES